MITKGGNIRGPVYSHISYVNDDLGVVPYTTWHTDWNPWNDPESDMDSLIANIELQEAIYCWIRDIPAPWTGATVTTTRLQALIYFWLHDLSMDPGEEKTSSQIAVNRTISICNVATNNTTDVTFTVNVEVGSDQDVSGPMLNETYPTDWNITPISNKTTFKNTTTEWMYTSSLSGGTNLSIVYNVTVPYNETGGIYDISGSVSAYNVGETEVSGDFQVYVMDDWNPWNDYDSDGSPGGRYITIDEVIEAYDCYLANTPVPRTGAYISIDDVIQMYDAYNNGTPM